MPRKPVFFDAKHADESLQAILERRSLLLSPVSAWNALVRAEVLPFLFHVTSLNLMKFPEHGAT
jgi:hypothetical protein